MIVVDGSPDGAAPVPLPEQVPAREGFAQVRGAKLWYWDTGGDGPAVVFVHAQAGSDLSWEYQQPVFAKAGLRVIAYSRRNHHKSDLAAEGSPGTMAEDLEAFVDCLGLENFHLIGTAQGGNVATEYALAHAARLSSLVLASRTAGVKGGAVAKALQALKPDNWGDLPLWFQELGPSYRATNPEGVQQWIDVNVIRAKRKGARQGTSDAISVDQLEALAVPTLLITGTADLTAPPSLVRVVARHLPRSEVVIVPEAGHSLYWERPDVFNRIVLDFLTRHSKQTVKPQA